MDWETWDPRAGKWEQGAKAKVDLQELCSARLFILSPGFTGVEGRKKGKRPGIRHPKRGGQRESNGEKGRQSEGHTHPLRQRWRER